jgi:hypothetical protein
MAAWQEIHERVRKRMTGWAVSAVSMVSVLNGATCFAYKDTENLKAPIGLYR